jgi:hypothetical protein
VVQWVVGTSAAAVLVVISGAGADDDIGVIEGTLGPAPTEAALTEAERFFPLFFSRTFLRLDVYLLYLFSRLCCFFFVNKSDDPHTLASN